MNNLLIKLINGEDSIQLSKDCDTTYKNNVLLKGLLIYKLFGVVPLIIHREWSNGHSWSRIDTVYIHFGKLCPNDSEVTSHMYTDDLYQIHGEVYPINLQDKPLISAIYGDRERGDGDQRIYVTTCYDAISPNDGGSGDDVPFPRYIYIIRLIPNQIKALMSEVCDQILYMPPNYMMVSGGIEYQKGYARYMSYMSSYSQPMERYFKTFKGSSIA